MDYNLAKDYLANLQLDECENFFKQNNCFLEIGYCELLRGKINEAKRTFNIVRNGDLRASWAYIFIQFMQNHIMAMPTYFQIRNFLEIDIGFLIKAQMYEYLENVINAADLFFEVNQESYKFISRVLLNYNFDEAAEIYLDRGSSRCFNDPELHFLYGNYYLKYNDVKSAKHEFETCLDVLGGYYPAIMMLEKLNNS